MRRLLEIPFDKLTLSKEEILALQGYPSGAQPGARVEALLAEAIDELARAAAPRGLAATTDREEFRAVYDGLGRNETETPVGDILPRAEHLALFAVTVGEGVTARIQQLFAAQEFALGSMLDSAASDATERVADVVEAEVLEALTQSGAAASTRLLRYSPGYCGWHVSGQQALFRTLKPEEIGITLGESFLMTPLKSMSGVILGGPAEIHDFEMGYSFCPECTTIGCRERIRHVMEV